jgi:hypothetical protein
MLNKTNLSHGLINLSVAPDMSRFTKRCTGKDAHQLQERILRKIIKDNSACQFGADNHFSTIQSINDFRSALPIVTYEQIHETIIRQAQTGKPLLTTQKPRRYHPTSGTSLATKFIPYTKELSAQYARGINVWLGDLYSNFPALKRGRHFWSISPKIAPVLLPGIGTNKAVIGFDDDAQYLWMERFYRKKYHGCSIMASRNSLP